MKEINIALLGLGTVGSGVYRALEMNREKHRQELGVDFKVRKILVSDTGKKRPLDIQADVLTDNIEEALREDIDIVVEVMGSKEFARKTILEAFDRGKHVVSANKDMIAEYAKELYEKSSEKKCFFLYEASVCGGIPILRTIQNHLQGEKIEQVMGIVNGTTNFILSKMQEEGASYESVLMEAQALGYAEADPTGDVEGLDAARKMAIVSSLCFGCYVELKDVYTEGITKIALEDVKYAKKFGYTIKLLGMAKEEAGGIQVHVYPVFVSDANPISRVNGAYNAVKIKSNILGDSMYYGAGAGSLPTASAVVSDMVDIAKKIQAKQEGQRIDAHFTEKKILSIKEIYSGYYIRMRGIFDEDCLSEKLNLFINRNIPIKETLWEEYETGENGLVVLTGRVKEEDLRSCLEEWTKEVEQGSIDSVIRVEE